jgi:hypothetical protein
MSSECYLNRMLLELASGLLLVGGGAKQSRTSKPRGGIFSPSCVVGDSPSLPKAVGATHDAPACIRDVLLILPV